MKRIFLLLPFFMLTAGRIVSVGPQINVKLAPYSAKCDGSTDDHVALQAAVTAGSGGSVFFPPGTCVTSTDLTFPNNVRIYGVHGQSKIKSTHAAGYIFKAGGVAKNSVTIQDLVMFTTNDANAASAGVFCDAVCTDLTIANNEFYYFYDYSFRANTAQSLRVVMRGNLIHDITQAATASGITPSFLDYSTIEDNLIYNIGTGLNTQWGIYASAAGTGDKINHNTVVSSTSGGIQIYTSNTANTFKDLEVSHNTIAANGAGLTLWEAEGLQAQGNMLWRCGVNLGQSLKNWSFNGNTVDMDTINSATVALVFDGAGAASTKIIGKITNNNFLSRVVGANNVVGIQIYPVKGLVISGNTFDDFGTAIQGVGGASDGVQIVNNYFKLNSSSGYGIDYELAGTNFLIANNTIEGNGGFTFADLENVNGVRVQQNIVTGSISTPMRVGTASHVRVERNIFPAAVTDMGGNTDAIYRGNRTNTGAAVDGDYDQKTGITASATHTEAGATALVNEYNTVTTAGANDTVVLLAPLSGLHQRVWNKTGQTINIYPAPGSGATGVNICAAGAACAAADASVTLTDTHVYDCIGQSATVWNCQ